ncbi:uncharacterized protein LOC108911538 [Anoplophora glabripennis]|uniref:uncharacterized protein LOC108911538 n=1 Tax=Anoplophora glabripennis TaxID=217634 RepID=UPI000874915E|nr:uncharacterized protein LOC108911538 [Anoplophora glabripennis]
MTFGGHVRKAWNKTDKTATAFARLMPNTEGPGQKKRAVMASTVDSLVLYAASAWAHALRINRRRDRMLKTQRKMSLRIAHAYWTFAFHVAANVIAGVIPLDLKVEERKEIQVLISRGFQIAEAKNLARRETMARKMAVNNQCCVDEKNNSGGEDLGK